MSMVVPGQGPVAGVGAALQQDEAMLVGDDPTEPGSPRQPLSHLEIRPASGNIACRPPMPLAQQHRLRTPVIYGVPVGSDQHRQAASPLLTYISAARDLYRLPPQR